MKPSVRRVLVVVVVALLVGALLWLAVRPSVVPGPEPSLPDPGASLTTAPPPATCTVGPVVVDDVSRLNPAEVGAVCLPTTEQHIRDAVDFSREHGMTVSIAGKRHSQGGQISQPGGLLLDMTGYRGVHVEDGVATALSGSSWADVQDAANAQGLAVRVQQSSNIFTVGGSLSVDCHGRDTEYGAIASTVRAFRILLADGRVLDASPDALPGSEEAQLFASAIGGYGLLGVILDVQLDLRPNAVVLKTTAEHDYGDYVDRLRSAVLPDDGVELHYGRLNIDSLDEAGFLRAMYSVEYTATGEVSTGAPMVTDTGASMLGPAMEIGEWSKLAKKARWAVLLDRVDVPGKTEQLTLNDAMRPQVQFLFERAGTVTVNILQEYFVPPEGFVGFIDTLREVAVEHGVDIQNVTTRWVAAGDSSLLSYAPDERIAVVLYVNLLLTESGIDAGERWTRRLVEGVLDRGGTYYLAYQRWPTGEQLGRGYPRWPEFVAAKRRFDPDGLFTNQFWTSYGPGGE